MVDTCKQQKPGQLVTGSDDAGGRGPNKTLALGIGVYIGVVSLIAFIILLVVLRKRRRRVLEEKKRRLRLDFVID